MTPFLVFSCGTTKRLVLGLPLSVALFVAMTASPAWARLGESEAQIKQRYGEPFRESQGDIGPGLSDKEMYFNKGDIVVIVSIKNGRSVGEAYCFSELGQKMEIEGKFLSQAAAIVETNSQGHMWEKHPAPGLQNPEIKHFWARDDGQAVAIVWKKDPDRLQITTMEMQEEGHRSRQAAEAGVDGF